MKLKWITLILILTTACAAPVTDDITPLPTQGEPVVTPTNNPAAEAESATNTPSNIDILANLPDPVCNGLTPSNQEGPYYTPNTPKRTSLIEDGIQGDKLILSGYVLSPDCLPIPNVWLDFWQANASGEYDNAGYTLRGHQFTDNKGRYYLETIMPGLYSSRPIEHIHVKLQVGGGDVFTTQLYFPTQPIDGLTVNLQEIEGYYLGAFDFVIQP